MFAMEKWRGFTLTLSVKPNALTISLSKSGQSNVYSFDAQGRLWTAMQSDIAYRRGLDGKIVAKWGTINTVRERRWLSPSESRSLEDSARLFADDLWQDMQSGTLTLNPSPNPPEMELLSRAARFDQLAYQADIDQYHRTYKPVGILPPDQYMALVLQLTEGCSFNTCTFCNFYRDRPFRIKTPAEFDRHCRDAREFLANGLSLRRTIFLGDANALVTPIPRLVPLLETIHNHYDVESLGGLFAFLDGFSGERKTHNDYAKLSNLGMKRIYIGMESGNPDLLKFLEKPGQPEDVLHAVEHIKAAGISVGIIVLLGAGGHTYAKAHVEDTVNLINRMPLDLDDLIYFSELIESEGIPYTQKAFSAGLQPLTESQRIQQGNLIESQLIFDPDRGIPHISRYDIRDFVY